MGVTAERLSASRGRGTSVSRRTLLVGFLWAGLVACGPRKEAKGPLLAPPRESTTLGPGDVFALEIVGEPELPKEYQVGTDGTVTLPFVQRVTVSGLEPEQVAEAVRARLVEEQILSSPSVIVVVREYRSKQVTVLGQVQRPGSFPLGTGLTLLRVVSQAGGFTSLAQTSSVRVTRVTDGEPVTVVIDVDAILEGRHEDIPLQAGDRVMVPERVF